MGLLSDSLGFVATFLKAWHWHHSNLKVGIFQTPLLFNDHQINNQGHFEFLHLNGPWQMPLIKCDELASIAVMLLCQQFSKSMFPHCRLTCVIDALFPGLVLADVSDWAAELRPSMRKLRQAMDGLLKGGRLAHAVLRVRGPSQQPAMALQLRRDVCFSQAVNIRFFSLCFQSLHERYQSYYKWVLFCVTWSRIFNFFKLLAI